MTFLEKKQNKKKTPVDRLMAKSSGRDGHVMI